MHNIDCHCFVGKITTLNGIVNEMNKTKQKKCHKMLCINNMYLITYPLNTNLT